MKYEFCTDADERYDFGADVIDLESGQSVYDIHRYCPESVQTCPDTVHRPVYGLSDILSEFVHGHEWTWKARRKPKNRTPVAAVKKGVSILAFIMSVGTTIAMIDGRIQFLAYLGTAAITILLDGFQLAERVLAPQSRLIIFVMAVMTGIITFRQSVALVLVTFLILTGGCFLIWKLNYEWLAGDAYLCNEHVQKTLNNDPEAKGSVCWQDHGKREARTLAYELGYPSDENIVEILYRPMFIAGFYTGWKKTEKAKSKIEKAQQKAEAAREEASRWKTSAEKLTAELNQIRVQADNDRQAVIELEGLNNSLHQMYRALKAENDALRAANDELVASLPEPEIIVRTVEQQSDDQDERIRTLIQSGQYSIRRIADIVGCKKWQVEKIKREMDTVVYLNTAQ